RPGTTSRCPGALRCAALQRDSPESARRCRQLQLFLNDTELPLATDSTLALHCRPPAPRKAIDSPLFRNSLWSGAPALLTVTHAPLEAIRCTPITVEASSARPVL